MREQPYLHLDETSYTYLANGVRKVAWVWVSADTIYYEVALSRGKRVLEWLVPESGEMIVVIAGRHITEIFCDSEVLDAYPAGEQASRVARR